MTDSLLWDPDGAKLEGMLAATGPITADLGCSPMIFKPVMTEWEKGFERDADGNPVSLGPDVVTRADGTSRVQTLYRRKDGSAAQI